MKCVVNSRAPRLHRWVSLVLLLVSTVHSLACSPEATSGRPRPTDTGTIDADFGTADQGPQDAESLDVARVRPDSGSRLDGAVGGDSGIGNMDGGPFDAGVVDTGVVNADVVDIGATDAGPETVEPADQGFCFGTANVAGSVPASYSANHLDAGRLSMLLHNQSSGEFQPYERIWFLNLAVIPGQYSYPPTSGLARCAVIEWTGTGWRAVTEIQGCEVILSELRLSSDAAWCEGQVSGVFRGFLPGSEFVVGAFSMPTAIREGDLATGCRPYGGRCSRHEECCSGSCGIYWGSCN